jgi:transcription elongation factor GreA
MVLFHALEKTEFYMCRGPQGLPRACILFCRTRKEALLDKIPMTVQGHKTLTAEFEHRTSSERRRIIDAIAEARAHGDLSENAEYSAAKEQQSLNEGRIKELETMLALADIIDVTKLSGDKVKFGATVTFIDEDTEEEKTYQVVGDPEADASAGRISISSPIARAMIGKEEGDSFEVAAPGGSRSYEILKVRYI